jgi:hypothetical protein
MYLRNAQRRDVSDSFSEPGRHQLAGGRALRKRLQVHHLERGFEQQAPKT